MFDGIAEKELEKRLKYPNHYGFTLIDAVALFDQKLNGWRVKIVFREREIERELYIDTKRGETKLYASLNTIAAKLVQVGLKRVIVDLSAVNG